MRTTRMLTGFCAAMAATSALAQSDGRSFDAAVVLYPGLTLQRGAVYLAGTYDSGLLRHGDILYTDNNARGVQYIVTSDGSVIGIAPATTVTIDSRQTGFNVFRVLRGSANVLGNVNQGYPLPAPFTANLPLRIGNVTVQENPYNPVWPQVTTPIANIRRPEQRWFGGASMSPVPTSGRFMDIASRALPASRMTGNIVWPQPFPIQRDVVVAPMIPGVPVWFR